jgi:serine protease Do
MRAWLRPRRCLIGLALLASACTATAAPQVADPRGPPDSFAPLVKKVLPAVVNIAVTETVSGGDVFAQLPPELQDTPLGREFRRRFSQQREQVMGAGSGFVVDPSGIIVTNNHVVGHATRIVVGFTDGKQMPARVIGSDELTDVAVIKVNTDHSLPAVTFGDSDKVEVGDWILAAGNPFGLGGSVTAGIVSAEGRDIGEGPFDRFLQLDAPINPGTSGGPAFNLDGQVVGMTTAIVSPSGGSVGIGFAIPSNVVAHDVTELRAHGSIERGWLGVSVQDLDQGGVAIAGLEPTGPAQHAGLRTGDVVVAVDGRKIGSTTGLIRTVAEKPPGTTVQVTVRRAGREMTIPVRVGHRPQEQSG